MLTFLEETIAAIKESYSNLDELIIILPSKRAGGFLKNYLRKETKHTIFSPKVISIEEFIEELSDLKIIDSTELLFKSYDVFLKTFPSDEKEDFETYASWATTLLNDFNEIDRYLIDPKLFFSYLASIKTLERWGVKEETDLIKDYLKFWNNLLPFYISLKETLLKQSIGYQGLVYREASEALTHYITAQGDRAHIFIGFNALNSAEQHIVQELLETGKSDIFWDSDEYFYQDKNHSASIFLREYAKEWKYYQNERPTLIGKYYSQKKALAFIAVQKNIGQAKYVGQLLSTYSVEKLNNTAVVLADEHLLLPLLNSLPQNVTTVNITMGVSLKTFPSTVFFELLIAHHLNSSETLYYKDVIKILHHPLGLQLIPNASNIITQINHKNITHLSLEALCELSEEEDIPTLKLLFSDIQNDSSKILKICLAVITLLKDVASENNVERLVLFQIYSVFNRINTLNAKFSHIKTVKTVLGLFSELIATTTLDFKGDAYNGLQIMGILETRVLDFENVIITSVNEGTLPSGKSNASFITYDLKQQFGLPQYFEKDAVYTYHFYHLLHRAKEITLLYNNHSEGINTGEKSRFLLQLEIEKLHNHHIKKSVLTPAITIEKQALRSISKTNELINRLQEIAEKGFSPSALASYIRNPLEFYYQKILKINEFQEVEETVAANTLGTIVHDTLEVFYKPLEGKYLSSEWLKERKKQIDEEVTTQFQKTFKNGTFSKGKNLIIFEVAKRYVSNFIDYELSELASNNKIKILQIEKKFKVSLDIEELTFPVNIGGTVDRVDEYNGKLRIIDYKTGKVNQADVEIVDWDEMIVDYKFSKAFQVLAYATMINRSTPITEAEAGIISFKNLNSGFLRFGTKEKLGSRTKDQVITQKVLESYKVELKKLILEICNPNIPLIEKETDV